MVSNEVDVVDGDEVELAEEDARLDVWLGVDEVELVEVEVELVEEDFVKS